MQLTYRFHYALCVLLGLGGAACRRADVRGAMVPPPASEWFEEISANVGLEFVHNAGPLPGERYFMPQIMGSGAALFDYDDDGRLDIYLVQNAGPDSKSPNQLFHQESDGAFTNQSAGSGLDVAGHGMGVAIGDANNDGRVDVVVTEYGRVRFFRNDSDGRFTEITREAGMTDPLWATAAALFDYDRDGWLDLVLVNYLQYDPTRLCPDRTGKLDYCGPSSFPGTVTMLYRNLGRSADAAVNAVRFEDVTLKSGLGRRSGPGLGVLCADFNGDQWPDIFIADDGQANRLWINQRDGTFTEEAVPRGLAFNALGQAEANMGVAYGDVRGEGLFDVFVTHLTGEMHTLWAQQPRGLFQDRTATLGLAHPAWRGTGFGTVFGDIDNDGALDLAVVNGRVRHEALLPAKVEEAQSASPAPDLGPFWSRYAQRNQLFRADGAGGFRDVSDQNRAFCGAPAVSRGLACGDIDNDGGVDLLVSTVADRARLYRNVAAQRGNWLLIRAIDPILKRDAYGAQITVTAGGRKFVRWINPGFSYLSSNDPRAHFGLGAAREISEIRVLWPDGHGELFAGGSANQVLVLRKGDGRIE